MNRAKFFELTRLNADSHTALRGRDQEPVRVEERNGYTPFGALAVLIADSFASAPDGLGSNRSLVTGIVRDCLPLLCAAGADIEASYAAFMAGADDAADSFIYAGRIATQQGNTPFVGTVSDMAAALAAEPRVLRLAMVNVTIAYTVLEKRAGRAGFEGELASMWPDPKTFETATERKETTRKVAV